MPKILPIVKNPDPILRKKSLAVSKSEIASEEIKILVADMMRTVEETQDAIGLAAPQVGIGKRIFVVKLPEYEGVFINPQLIDPGKTKTRNSIEDEGCLSVPATYGPVVRERAVKIKAIDAQGKEFKLRAKGLLARVIQHELDHLNGKLFIDKAEHTFKV